MAADQGHRETDQKLRELIRQIDDAYNHAIDELQERVYDYMDQFTKQDAEKRVLLDSGELSQEEYQQWRFRKLMGTKQWENMRDRLANELVHADQLAASMINDALPDVYAINHNYGTFEAESGSGIDTTYTMYDRSTVARLLKDDPDLLPKPSPSVPKIFHWNRQHIQAAVLQGILQGLSMKAIADKFQEVAAMDERAAMRNARTAVTGAENAGRIDSYKRAESMGIKMKQVWMATLDGRTRDSHRHMDGEKQEVGQKFSNGCRFPGDPQGKPGEIYNCRCTLVAEVEGADPYDPAARTSDYLKSKELTYEQWKNMHSKQPGPNGQQPGKFDRSTVQYSERGRVLMEHLEKAGIEWKEVTLLPAQLTEKQIIDRIAGGDRTKGSCFSLACAYAGNKSGLDVLDFRGGKSQDYFAGAYYAIYRFEWVGAKIESKGGINPAKKLLNQMKEGKEYIFTTGRHSAITRVVNGKMQYLELQSAKDSGWHSFEETLHAGTWYERKLNTSDTLKLRFGCGSRAVSDSSLIDIDVFKDSDEFRDLLGYINTAEDQQKKGSSGTIK